MAGLVRVQRGKAQPSLSSSSFMSGFLQIFHEQEPLWNTKHPDYNKRNIREECYDVLVEKMQEVQPDATRDDVTKKINSLRSAFRKEYKKVLRSVEMGEVHTPRLWYYNRLLFLIGQDQQQDSDADVVKSDEHGEAVRVLRRVSTFAQTQGQFQRPDSYDEANSPAGIEDLEYETDPLNEASFQEDHSDNDEAPRSRAPKRRRRQAVTSTQHAPAVEGHPSIFGRHVAAKLASVADDQRVYLEKLINDAIFEAELGNLSRDSGISLH